MNARFLTVVSTVMLLASTTGCGSIRNFLFGRGARCGQPIASQPVMPSYGAVAAPGCNTCSNQAHAGTGECGCYGSAYGSTDQYLGSGVVDGGYVNGGQYVDGGYGVNGFGDSGRWQARKYDSQGDVIISEDPMPTNAIVSP